MDNEPQAVRLPSSTKLDANDNREYNFEGGSTSNEEKRTFSGTGTGTGTGGTGSGSGTIGSGSGTLPSSSGGSVSSGISVPGNSNVGKEVRGFNIAWREGSGRSKISGDMPRYPENSNKEVQIKVQVTVAPDGSITQIVPLQKADHAFENSVTTALRTWKFEKLRGVPEEPQIAVITFNFKLE
jgi:outer membrane biosynthesis protein TonB